MPDAPQAYLAAVFCLASVITTLNANGLPLLEFDSERYRANLTAAAALGALPGTAVFFTLLRAPTLSHPLICLSHTLSVLHTPACA